MAGYRFATFPSDSEGLGAKNGGELCVEPRVTLFVVDAFTTKSGVVLNMFFFPPYLRYIMIFRGVQTTNRIVSLFNTDPDGDAIWA